MRRLYLHIGTGKTGSTSIQYTFSGMDSKGFSFFYDMNGVKGISNLEEFLERLQETQSDKVIYSNEWLYKASESFIKKINKKLRPFFDIKVVIYLRRQDEFVISAYQQVAKSGQGSSEYGAVALPMDFDKSNLDYYKIVSRWAALFGKENIIIRKFSRDSLQDGCVVKDFSEVTGVCLREEDIVLKNESVDFLGTKIGHIANRSGISRDVFKSIVADAPLGSKMLPARSDAEAFYSYFVESNIKLKNEYDIASVFDDVFGMDFSKYPEKRSDLWDENSANEGVEYLMRRIESDYISFKEFIPANVSLLRDAAIALEKVDLDLSFKLMSLAAVYRPNGILIQRKLSAYSKKLGLD